MRVAQVGQEAVGARGAWGSSCVLTDVAAELSLRCVHVRVVRAVVGGPKAVAEGGCAAAGGQEDRGEGGERWVSDAESDHLDGDLGAEPSFLGDGDLSDSTDTLLEEGLHFLGPEVKAGQGLI